MVYCGFPFSVMSCLSSAKVAIFFFHIFAFFKIIATLVLHTVRIVEKKSEAFTNIYSLIFALWIGAWFRANRRRYEWWPSSRHAPLRRGCIKLDRLRWDVISHSIMRNKWNASNNCSAESCLTLTRRLGATAFSWDYHVDVFYHWPDPESHSQSFNSPRKRLR